MVHRRESRERIKVLVEDAVRSLSVVSAASESRHSRGRRVGQRSGRGYEDPSPKLGDDSTELVKVNTFVPEFSKVENFRRKYLEKEAR